LTQGPFITGVLTRRVEATVNPGNNWPEEKEDSGDPLEISHEHITSPEMGDFVHDYRLQLVRPNE
jgi:hypothetical protein